MYIVFQCLYIYGWNYYLLTAKWTPTRDAEYYPLKTIYYFDLASIYIGI